MKTFTADELNKILENHKHWLFEDCDGWESLRADLRDANLSGVDLRHTILNHADLREVNLPDADLHCANLSGADLIYGYLTRADLHCANLSGTNLRNAILRDADLRNANLSGADLSGVELCGANLNGVNLNGANLHDAHLSGAVNIPFIPMACPDIGEFIGWKKAVAETNWGSYYCIVKLFIPSDAKRSSATSRKCRCDKAVVVDIEVIGYHRKDPITILKCFSQYDEDFTYEIHKTVSVDTFDEDRFHECAPGIHFFINKQEAIDY